MDTPVPPTSDAALYERDFHAWCMEQAARLRARARPGANDGLDYENLAEEIESLGRSDRRAIKSHLRVLIAHLLKWRVQAERRGPSWATTINNARTQIQDLLSDSPSLVAYSRDLIGEVYPSALRDAATETELPSSAFPPACPFTADDVFDPDYLPDR
jgi:hypothetical protein